MTREGVEIGQKHAINSGDECSNAAEIMVKMNKSSEQISQKRPELDKIGQN